MSNERSFSPFDPDQFARLARVEERHFWFRTRAELIFTLTEQALGEVNVGCRFLEAGCGNGSVLSRLARGLPGSQVVGFDLYGEGLGYARGRWGRDLVQGDLAAAPFSPVFDGVGLFDVLEHLEDDRLMLMRLADLVRSGGFLLLTVPAHRSLWSYFDVISHHQRRYEPEELTKKVVEAGLEIEFLSHFMFPLFPVLWIGRRLNHLLAQSFGRSHSAEQMADADLRIIPFINEVLVQLLSLERSWLRRRRTLPLGTSLLLLARKP